MFATSGGLYLRRLQQSEKNRAARAQAQNLQIQRQSKEKELGKWKGIVQSSNAQIENVNTKIQQATKELMATQKYISTEQAGQVNTLNSQLDLLKSQYDAAVSTRLDLTKSDYENQLLEASTILEASRAVTDVRIFRERVQYMRNVRHAKALMDESDSLEQDIVAC